MNIRYAPVIDKTVFPAFITQDNYSNGSVVFYVWYNKSQRNCIDSTVAIWRVKPDPKFVFKTIEVTGGMPIHICQP